MIVIATDMMYLVGKRIYSIYIDEDIETRYVKRRKVDIASYLIKVTFEPDDLAQNPNSSRSNDIMTVEYKVYGRSRALHAYRDIVQQIREQCPDQLYLDKIAERFLARSIEDDACTAEICEIGETERRSEEVLRRTKGRAGRRSKRNWR